MSSAAEQALKKKFALLQKRKQEAAGGGKGKTGGGASGTSAQPKSAAPTAQDAARQAAIRALQAKRAEAAAAGGSPAGGAEGAEATGSEAATKPGGTKLKLVIPKREMPAIAGAGSSAVNPAQQQQQRAPSDPARAAALAALRANSGQPGSAARPASGAAAAAAAGASGVKKLAAAAAAAQTRQPGLKRPSARPRPMPQQQLQAAAGSAGAAAAAALDGTFGPEAAQLQQQHLEQYESSYGGNDEGPDGRAAKRQRQEREAADGATLFVGDLPQYWGTPELLDFFSREFGNAVEARVIGSQAGGCYGFVTFSSPADAEGVLEFAQSQGVWAEDRMLRINWAQGSMPEWKKGPAVYRNIDPDAGGEGSKAQPVLEAYEHPRVKEARLQAQQLAAQVDAQQIQALAMAPPPRRQLVSYEDL
ncbi:hypothetical protein ABPG77_004178 [Micractinium sp. CCAP 211/92]